MRVPLSWLRDYVEIELEPGVLAERLTLLGMEVKGIERWGADWQLVVVGELLTVEKHPRADRLSLTTVRIGDEVRSIVCGATNIRPGMRVPVALPGAVLPGGRRIERTEKMGVPSDGMLCSGDELQLTTDADGILILPGDTPLGADLSDLYGDIVLDVDVKPNRGDALSLVGLAREVSAATGAPLRWPETDAPETGPALDGRLSVEVREPGLCSRFVGRWVSGVRVGPAPDRVQMRLRAAGLRPVSNVVDASNYVMLELGKPTHAFDAAAVADGRIVVRRAATGEHLVTLDHVDRTLDPEILVIADPSGPLGLAGVIGGAASEVSESTTDVILESAIFDPVTIRRTGQRLGLRSEASLRFEKGQEVRLARIGADRVARLVAEWSGGSILAGAVDSAPDEPLEARVAFRPARVNRLLGIELARADQQALLERVGIATEEQDGSIDVVVSAEPMPLTIGVESADALIALVPTWRRDLQVEVDVAEEIARVHGYERIQPILPDTPMPAHRESPLALRDLVRDTLAGAGLTEVVTSALVSTRHLETFPLPADAGEPLDGDERAAGTPIGVTNPLSSEHAILRQELIGSLLDVVGGNLRQGRSDIAIFEVGKGYGRAGETAREWWRLAFALTGSAEPPAWNRVARPWDLDDAKGIVELLCRRIGALVPSYAPRLGDPILHPGRAADVESAGHLRGRIGELHPAVVDAWDLRAERIVVGELAIRGLAAGQPPTVRSTPIDRFPVVERDIAVVVDAAVPAAALDATIRGAAGELLCDVRLFDIYRGRPLGERERSLAFRLLLQAPDRTLTDEEIEAALEAVTAALAASHGAHLRA